MTKVSHSTVGGQAYPVRERMFAMRFGNLLMRTNAANTIGADACWLLMAVVLTEDATHYSRGVTFFTGQLLGYLGFGKWERLDAARRRAVDAGWLHYQAPPSGNRRPGTYWVLVPGFAQNLPDLPQEAYPDLGDGSTGPYPEKGDSQKSPSPGPSPGPYPEKGEPPSLQPHNPTDPNTKARAQGGDLAFVIPSLEEVRQFCNEENLPINVELFHGHYTESNWTKKGGDKIRCWKQAARNWHQRDIEQSKKGFSNGKRSTNHVGPGQRYQSGSSLKWE